MKKTVSASLFLGLLTVLARPAQAQFVVSDPEAEAADTTMATELGTANTTLGRIATSTQETATNTANTLTMMSTPTMIEGGFVGLDGGATANSAAASTELMPSLSGTTSTTTQAGSLNTQEKTNLQTDETMGLAQGNSEDEQEQRQRTAGTNIQGQAVKDFGVYADRFTKADTMEAKLSTVSNIKQAITYNGGIELQNLKALNLVGQSISLNTIATTQAHLDEINDKTREEDDHRSASKQFLAAAALGGIAVVTP